MAIRPGVNSTLNFKKYKTEFYKKTTIIAKIKKYETKKLPKN